MKRVEMKRWNHFCSNFLLYWSDLWFHYLSEINETHSCPWYDSVARCQCKRKGGRGSLSGRNEQWGWWWWSTKGCWLQSKEAAMGVKLLKENQKNLDKAYQKSLTKRAKERTLPRIVSNDLSEREPPRGLPDWAVENCNWIWSDTLAVAKYRLRNVFLKEI